MKRQLWLLKFTWMPVLLQENHKLDMISMWDQETVHHPWTDKLKKEIRVWYSMSLEATGCFIDSGMKDLFLIMFEEFMVLISKYPLFALAPAMPGTSLCKDKAGIILHGESHSMVGQILYFVKKLLCICTFARRNGSWDFWDSDSFQTC